MRRPDDELGTLRDDDLAALEDPEETTGWEEERASTLALLAATPERISDLLEIVDPGGLGPNVEEKLRSGYIPDGAGGFKLHPDMVALKAQLAAQLDEEDAKIKALEDRREKAQARLRAWAIKDAVTELLTAAGCDPLLKEGAAALLIQRNALEIHGREIRDATGTPLRELVETWTAEEGARYLTGYRQRKAATVGFFASRIRGLADPLQ